MTFYFKRITIAVVLYGNGQKALLVGRQSRRIFYQIDKVMPWTIVPRHGGAEIESNVSK